MAREMKDSGIKWIGEIPKNWEIYPAKRVFSEVITRNSNGDVRNALKFFNGTIIPKENFDAAEDSFVADTILNYTIVEPDTIMVNGLNLNFDLKSQRIGIVREKGVITSAYLALSPLREYLIPEFANYLLKGYESKMALHNMGSGLRLTLGYKEMKNQPILLPSLEEQHRIASFLDSKCAEIDKAIEATKASIEEYRKLRQAIITEAVTKGLDPDVEMKDSGIEWIGEIPNNWHTSKIDSLYALRNTKVSDYEYLPLSVTMNGIVPQLENAAKTNAHDDRKLVKAGDFAINSRSDRRGSCGISELDGSVSLINTVLRPLNNMSPRYYNWLFHTSSFADEFYKWGHGIVDDLWTTNWQDMRKISVPVPPISEQNRIAFFLDAKCSEIDSLIKSKEKLIEELTAYRKSLIYEYVTGKKEVPIESA